MELAASHWSSSTDELISATSSHILSARRFFKGPNYHIALDLDDVQLGCLLVTVHPVQHATLSPASTYAQAVRQPPTAHIRIDFRASMGSIVGQKIESDYSSVIPGPSFGPPRPSSNSPGSPGSEASTLDPLPWS